MSTKNWPLLIETMQFIIDHPEQWEQRYWANTCGTAYCFAGHASLLAGGRQVQNKEFAHRDDDEDPTDWTDFVVVPEAVKSAILEYSFPVERADLKTGDEAFHMADAATAALGLDEDESDDLFNGGNTLAAPLRWITDWAREDNIELPSAWAAYR